MAGTWKKGQSGNPGGKPKEVREVVKAARDLSLEAIERLAFWMRSDNPKASPLAANALLDRAYGKPAQSIAVSREDNPRPEEMSDEELVSIARGGSEGAAEAADGAADDSSVH